MYSFFFLVIYNHLKFSLFECPWMVVNGWWEMNGAYYWEFSCVGIVIIGGHMWQSVDKAPLQLSPTNTCFNLTGCHHTTEWHPEYIVIWCLCSVSLLLFTLCYHTIHHTGYVYHNVHPLANLSAIWWHL